MIVSSGAVVLKLVAHHDFVSARFVSATYYFQWLQIHFGGRFAMYEGTLEVTY
jgi:hypothetical protein